MSSNWLNKYRTKEHYSLMLKAHRREVSQGFWERRQQYGWRDNAATYIKGVQYGRSRPYFGEPDKRLADPCFRKGYDDGLRLGYYQGKVGMVEIMREGHERLAELKAAGKDYDD